MAKQLDYDIINWAEFFKYDTNSKSGLKWAIDKFDIYGKRRTIRAGSDAGTCVTSTRSNLKYWRVSLPINGNNSTYMVHRIIAVLHGKNINSDIIDHINGDSSDNRLENIRVTSQEINSRNCRISTDSPYGIYGVRSQQLGSLNYFYGDFREDGKSKTKWFSINVLGVMEAFKQAVIYRQKAIIRLNKQGSGYTDRHSSTCDSVLDFVEYVVPEGFRAEASRNAKIRYDNTSGVKGVWYRGSLSNFRAVCQWTTPEGERRSKSFSVAEYGLMPAFALAFTHRANALKELYKE